MITNKKTVTQLLSSLFGKSEKAISEKLSADEFNTFSQELQQAAGKLDARADEVPAPVAADPVAGLREIPAPAAVVPPAAPVAADPVALTNALAQVATLTAELATANAGLTTANATIARLQPKAASWDAYQASLQGAKPDENKPAGKSANTGLSAKDQAEIENLRRLKEKHPGLMEGIDIPDED